MDHELEEALHRIQSKSSICFVGAGFATDAKDSTGNINIPSSGELEKELCRIIGVDPEDGGNLSDLADFCESDPKLKIELQNLFLRRLTLTQPSENQKLILSLPWRSVFTTNFDDVVERALPEGLSRPISPTSLQHSLAGEGTPVVYLHGRARDILDSQADPKFVVSETNYINLHKDNANLYSALSNELHSATQIFFIGYSLRDADIAKKIFNINNTILKKSYVISSVDSNKISIARLSKFGSVFKIGLSGFAAAIKKHKTSEPSDISKRPLAYIARDVITPRLDPFEKDDVDKMILSGEFDLGCYSLQKVDRGGSNFYCVPREKRITELFECIASGVSRIIVSSDIGNGKTTFLSQISYEAIGMGYEVYRIKTRLSEVYEEIDFILKKRIRTIFIIDDLIRSRPIASYIGNRMHGLCCIICATRNSLSDYDFSATSTLLSGTAREIDLNILNDEELKNWDQLMERWGYWEGRITGTEADRISFLKNQCGSETRAIVVSTFKSSSISTKIDKVVNFFLKKYPQHSHAFIAILINAMCQKHVDWGRIVDWIKIDEIELQNTIKLDEISDFMSSSTGWYRFTSTQLADYIFKTYKFDENDVVEIYTKIVRETAHSSNDYGAGFDSAENLKELMKYRFLVRLFGDVKSAHSSILSVYKRLSSVKKIRNNDQFWLQYAMASMEDSNLHDAETYINTALGLAGKKGATYSPHQIIDQRCRLYIAKNSIDGKLINTDEIEIALSDLKNSLREKETQIIYPLRSSAYLLDFIDEKIDEISPELIGNLRVIFDLMWAKIPSGVILKAQKGETDFLRDTIKKGRNLLEFS